MKKTMLTTTIILGVGVAMILVGSILQGIVWDPTVFDGEAFALALNTLGYIVALLSGIVLTALGISLAIRGEKECVEEKKDEKKKDKE